jgi:hypothetical protein
VDNQRLNILILAVCIAAAMAFVAATPARVPERLAVAEAIASTGTHVVVNCDKVIGDSRCCMPLHCTAGITPGSFALAFRPPSSDAATGKTDPFQSHASGQLERPPKQIPLET